MKPSNSGVVRVASNFVRLFLTFAVGIFVVRVLLRFGDDAYGLIALLGTGTGVAMIFKEVVRFATVPVLGEAFHSTKEKWFSEIYNSALFSSVVAGVASLLIFGVFTSCLPLLKFPSELYSAALVFVLCSALQSLFTVSIAPLFNFYMVSERMVAYNSFLLLERLGELASAVITLCLLPTEAGGMETASHAIISYGICNASFSALIHLLAAAMIIRVDKRLVPNFRSVTRTALVTFIKSATWNGCVVLAMSLYAKADALLMNLFFGLFGNTAFTLANQSVSYVRSFIIGFASGLDAVASRVAKREGDQGVVDLLNRSTNLQAIVVLPAFCGLLFFATPLISLWLKGRVQNPEMIPAIVSLIQIMIFGVGARCLSEGWIWVMNGAGKVKSYAPLVLLGGILNPILAVIALSVVPEEYKFFAPACVFSTLMTIVHLIGLPMVVAREYKVSFKQVIGPIVSPCVVCGACLSLAILSSKLACLASSSVPFGEDIVLGSVFLISYSLGACFFLVSGNDRQRVVAMLKARLSRTSQEGR